ncbi:hypothetical protein Ancab_007447 [Ancistrocladus abbreviatus]
MGERGGLMPFAGLGPQVGLSSLAGSWDLVDMLDNGKPEVPPFIPNHLQLD